MAVRNMAHEPARFRQAAVASDFAGRLECLVMHPHVLTGMAVAAIGGTIYAGTELLPLSMFAYSSDLKAFVDVLFFKGAVLSLCLAAGLWLAYGALQILQKNRRHFEVVEALQTVIVPDSLAEAPGYELCGLYRPAGSSAEIGGTFYDFYANGSGCYGIIIGDVGDHGSGITAKTAQLRYSIRALAATGMGPAQIFDMLDLLIETQGAHFESSSLFFGLLDVRSRTMVYANAGHEAPLLKFADGLELKLEITGPPLGSQDRCPYLERTLPLGPNDSLLLVTDGVTEARDDNGYFLNDEGVWKLFRSSLSEPSANDSLRQIEQGLSTYIGSAQRDDITMLLLRGKAA